MVSIMQQVYQTSGNPRRHSPFHFSDTTRAAKRRLHSLVRRYFLSSKVTET